MSTDETAAVVADYIHLSHLKFISEKDYGQTDAINKGFRVASGDIIAWLNCDDYYLPGTFGAIAESYQAFPEAEVFYGDTNFVDETGVILRTKYDHMFDSNILLYYGCYIMSTSCFMRTSVLWKYGLLDDSYKVTMDFEYYVRLASKGAKFQFIPRLMACFRWHDSNISSTFADRRARERLNIQLQYGPSFSLRPELRGVMFKVLARIFRLKRGLYLVARNFTTTRARWAER